MTPQEPTTGRHIDPNDPQYPPLAKNILARHDNNEPEANITSAVRDFLILTGLATAEGIKEENPPSDTSRRAVDLTAHDTFVEMKRRVGTTGGNNPNPAYIEQLDDYLLQSQSMGKGVRMGILTDGKHWLLRWPNAGPVRTVYPYAFTLDDSGKWLGLFEWLRDKALVSDVNVTPTRDSIAGHFGPASLSYQRDIAALKSLYSECAAYETVRIKRRLWHDLLRTALGEIAGSPEELDDLFVRHTYLSAVVAMVVQATFGIDIYQKAETDPADLLHGRQFHSDTGLQGVVESDFFTWPTEVGGLPFLRTLARRVDRFDWAEAPPDVAAILYETVIPPEERRQLGEYYTPAWLARTMVRELVTEPLEQHVLDPACGSGTFIAEAVAHFFDAAKQSGLHPKQVLDRLRAAVTGIDVHPVAVHLARSAWALAAKPAILAVKESGYDASGTVPVYLGDSLQLRFNPGDMFAAHEVRIAVEDEQNTELIFPATLVEQADNFDALMGDASEYIEHGEDPFVALDDHGVNDPQQRQTLTDTLKKLQELHTQGRDHIWAYYSRNLVRPVTLARRKVDVIIGNPPWINYNQTADALRSALETQSKELYGIWAGGRYATHQDVAGLFFTRCADLYLKDGGIIGMVMPHSALQAGQYSKWRSGKWQARRGGSGLAADFSFKTAWDLEQLQPNTFFPVPASVVFARRGSVATPARPLAGTVERWEGSAGADDVQRVDAVITDTGVVGDSPYAKYSRNGATIFPRCLFFVEEIDNPAVIQAGRTVMVNPRRGALDKEPWRSLDLTAITGQSIETQHVFDVHMGETLVPYAMLEALKAALPVRNTDGEIPYSKDGAGGIRLGGLERRMRLRWQSSSSLWEENKAAVTRMNLLGQLDYMGKLRSQFDWRKNSGSRPIRIAYSSAGTPTAALLYDENSIVENVLFWVTCKNVQEAHYLLAIINSDALYRAVASLMPKGQFGARHLHKHLWKLPIPEYDGSNPLHMAISTAGEAAAAGAAKQLEQLRQDRPKLTVTIARRELRKWLRASAEGKAVEGGVAELLGAG